MKYKLNFCMTYALSMTLVCTAMENTNELKISLKNNYISELSYAELPIAALLGSKKVKPQPNVFKNNIKKLPSGATVQLNSDCLGLSVGTSTNVKLAYYDAGSDSYYGGLYHASHLIKEIQTDKPNHPYHTAAIITINRNPFYWSFSTTWIQPELKPTKKMVYSKQLIAKNAVSANPELLIDTHTEPGASFALISSNAITK